MICYFVLIGIYFMKSKCLTQCFSKHGSWTTSTSITWTPHKCKFLGSIPDLLNLKLGAEPSNLIWIRHPGNSDVKIWGPHIQPKWVKSEHVWLISKENIQYLLFETLKVAVQRHSGLNYHFEKISKALFSKII